MSQQGVSQSELGTQVAELRETMKALSAEIGGRKSAGEDVQPLLLRHQELSTRIKALVSAEARMDQVAAAVREGSRPAATPAAQSRRLISAAVVTDVEEFAGLRHEWNDLLARSSVSSVFSTWEWMYPWWGVYGGDKQLRLITVRDAEDCLVGLAPLMLGKRRRGRRGMNPRVLALIGTGEGPLADGLAFGADSTMQDDVRSIIWDECRAMADQWDIMHLEDVCTTDSSWALFAASALRGEYAAAMETRRLGVVGNLPSSFDECVQQMPGQRRRRNLRSALRRLEADHHGVQYTRETSAADIESCFEAMAHLSIQRRVQRNDRSAWESDDFRRCLTEAARRMAEKGRLRVDTLTIDKSKAAIVLGFVLGDTYQGFQSALDSRFAEVSPTHCLWARCIEESIKEGLNSFDFGPGEHDYKSGYFAGRKALGQILIGRCDPRGLMLVGRDLYLRGWRRRTRAWLRHLSLVAPRRTVRTP